MKAIVIVYLRNWALKENFNSQKSYLYTCQNALNIIILKSNKSIVHFFTSFHLAMFIIVVKPVESGGFLAPPTILDVVADAVVLPKPFSDSQLPRC